MLKKDFLCKSLIIGLNNLLDKSHYLVFFLGVLA